VRADVGAGAKDDDRAVGQVRLDRRRDPARRAGGRNWRSAVRRRHHARNDDGRRNQQTGQQAATELDSHVRVLLLDEGFASGAFTAFGLHAAGCRVDVIAAAGGRARCAATGGEWRLAPRPGERELEELIEGARRGGGYDAIYPTTEPLQRLLW